MPIPSYRGFFATLVAIATVALAVTAASPASAAGRLASFRAARAANVEAANTLAAANSAAALNAASAALDPACCAPAAPCCPTPCITYRHHGPKLCCGCAPSVETVLTVNNPCTCCPVQIPVCLPACCSGEPTVCCGRGLLGRTVVTYDWCCGFSVTVRFLHSGDIVVVTRGV
ncbi:MAG TPA: hypothetical protein VN699_10355 [Pirellulales bacterium]|jgi:hypothetical protein|nr:hypothetical protein [Pirellulales bacterium]